MSLMILVDAGRDGVSLMILVGAGRDGVSLMVLVGAWRDDHGRFTPTRLLTPQVPDFDPPRPRWAPDVPSQFELPFCTTTNPSHAMAAAAHDYDSDVEEVFEVERILWARVGEHDAEYLVKWVGYAEPTWEEAWRLDGCKESIAAYEQSLVEEEALLREAHLLAEREVIVID